MQNWKISRKDGFFGLFLVHLWSETFWDATGSRRLLTDFFSAKAQAIWNLTFWIKLDWNLSNNLQQTDQCWLQSKLKSYMKWFFKFVQLKNQFFSWKTSVLNIVFHFGSAWSETIVVFCFVLILTTSQKNLWFWNFKDIERSKSSGPFNGSVNAKHKFCNRENCNNWCNGNRWGPNFRLRRCCRSKSAKHGGNRCLKKRRPKTQNRSGTLHFTFKKTFTFIHM